MRKNILIHPYVRLMFLTFNIAGIIIIDKSIWLLFFYSIVIIPLFILTKQIKQHFKLMLFGMVPIFLSFLLLYTIILKSNSATFTFIELKMLKLITITSVIQLALAIPAENIVGTFQKWRLKGEVLITLLGAFTVWADVTYHANKIISARFSRGFIKKRTFFNQAKQFPFILVPLIIGILRTSSERAESWEQKNILMLINKNKIKADKYPVLFNTFLCSVSVIWLSIGAINYLIYG